MNRSKTFRLFISSTFSDFKGEREVLQSKIFPQIREYALEQGYAFQPIDLRWGVSNEAQLNQKTLELCLDEVKACKAYQHPNFLVMLGDRYGWVPLPCEIESLEFEALCRIITEEEKKNLNKWYIKDLNQLPISYVLQERVGEFIAFESWGKEETKLRGILQRAAETLFSDTKVNRQEKRKYFNSATEAEVDEGIISYLKPTMFQRKLMKKTLISPEIDRQHIFGFFRSVASSSKTVDTLIESVDDKKKAKAFKNKVSEILLPENSLQIEVKQIENNRLDESYLLEFQEKITQFLRSQIDAQKEREEQNPQTSLEVELVEQKYFSKIKRKNFIGQEKQLKQINEYIFNDNQQPLGIIGKSGSGKSALMAKAIKQTQQMMPNENILYCFVGATTNSTSMKKILISLFEQLNIDVSNELPSNGAIYSELSNRDNLNSRLEKRMYSELLNVKSPTVIFIDGLEQLHDSTNYYWLPDKLPPQVKIIISVLNDERYPGDSSSFDILKTITDQFVKLPSFEKPADLIDRLLLQAGRTLQSQQKESILNHFSSDITPFSISLAISEMKHWHSNKVVNTSNNELLFTSNNFIDDLINTGHHHKEFVYRVLSYLLASKGLSEYELLQLLSDDADFIELIAPDNWHQNITKELPIVHWSRLSYELKPFLSIKFEGGAQLLYISNREFRDAIMKLPNLKKQYQAIIESTQHLIIKSQKSKGAFRNEWDDLYAILVSQFLFHFHDEEVHQKYAEFIAKTPEIIFFWQEKYFTNLLKIGNDEYLSGNLESAKCAFKSSLHAAELLLINEESKRQWIIVYVESIKGICDCYYSLFDYEQEQYYREKLTTKLFSLYENEYSDDVTSQYIYALGQLGECYSKQQKMHLALNCFKQQESIITKLFSQNPTQWGLDYAKAIVEQADYYYNQGQIASIHEYLVNAKNNLTLVFNENKIKYGSLYTRIINYIAESFVSNKNYDKALVNYEEVYELRKSLVVRGNSQTELDYARALNNLATMYQRLEIIVEAIDLFKESLELREKLYFIKKTGREKLYLIGLKHLAQIHFLYGDPIYSITLYEKYCDVVKALYDKHSKEWVKRYIAGLVDLCGAYTKVGETNDALIAMESAYQVAKRFYGEQHAKTEELLSILELIKKKTKSDSYDRIEFEDISDALFDESISSELAFENNKEKTDTKPQATMLDLFSIAKVIALQIGENEITLDSFAIGIGHIELNYDVQSALSTWINLDAIPNYSDSGAILYHAEQIKDTNLPISEDVLHLISGLQIFMSIDGPIGTFR